MNAGFYGPPGIAVRLSSFFCLIFSNILILKILHIFKVIPNFRSVCKNWE